MQRTNKMTEQCSKCVGNSTIRGAVFRLCNGGMEAKVDKLRGCFVGVFGGEHDVVWVEVSMQNPAAGDAGVQVHQCPGNVHAPPQAVCVCVDAPDWVCHLLQDQLPDRTWSRAPA